MRFANSPGLATSRVRRVPVNFAPLDSRICWYHDTIMKLERVQTGIRLEKRLLKVLKALAEHLEISVGELIEGMALHAFEDVSPFTEETRSKIQQLKAVYDLDLTADDSHNMGDYYD